VSLNVGPKECWKFKEEQDRKIGCLRASEHKQGRFWIIASKNRTVQMPKIYIVKI
jgi:hypothetical protein